MLKNARGIVYVGNLYLIQKATAGQHYSSATQPRNAGHDSARKPLIKGRTILLVKLKVIADVGPSVVVVSNVIIQLHRVETSNSVLLN